MSKINLGSGLKRYEGFLNIDHDPAVNPDYVVNIDKDVKLPFEDCTVDEVKAYHLFEHLSDGFFPLMQELYRVAENGCILDIQVPHHRSEIWYGDPTHCRFITIDNMRLFNKSYNDWHMAQWNSSTGFGNKLNVNWVMIEFNFIVDGYWAPKFQTMTQEQIDDVSRNFNNVYGETHIKMMAVKE